MRAAMLLLVLALPLAASESQTPFIALGGWNYLSNGARNQTTDEGLHLGLVTILHESALVGIPCLDVDFRQAIGQGQRIDSIGTCYVERFTVEGNLYGGLGAGSSWHRLRLKSDGEDVNAERYRITAKALLGYRVVDRLVVEAQYHRSGMVEGFDTSGITLSAGWWF